MGAGLSRNLSPRAGRRARLGLGFGVNGTGGYINFDANSDNFLSGLGKECAFLSLEKARCRATACFRPTFRGRGGEEGHEFVAGGWSWETGT